MEKRERSKDEIPFRELTTSQKISYLWDYWKMPVIIIACVVVVVVSLAYTMLTSKDPLLSVTMVDVGNDTSFTPYIQNYGKEQGIPEDQLVISDMVVGTAATGGGASSQSGMAFYVRLQAGGEDVVILPEEVFTEFASGGYFLDLTDVVPNEWQEKLVVVAQRYDEFDQVQPEPIACGIKASDIPGMPDTPYYENAVVALSYYPTNYDQAVDFLTTLLTDADKQ